MLLQLTITLVVMAVGGLIGLAVTHNDKFMGL